MEKLKDGILWLAVIVLSITGMLIPDSSASYFETWYLAFFVALVVYIVLMIIKEK